MLTRHAPTYSPERQSQRCCARCKTPYNCANQACICHARVVPVETALAVAKEIAARNQELLDRLGDTT